MVDYREPERSNLTRKPGGKVVEKRMEQPSKEPGPVFKVLVYGAVFLFGAVVFVVVASWAYYLFA